MRYLSVLTLAVLAVSLPAVPVRAANQLPRHLVYSVSIRAEQNVEIKTDNMGTSGGTSQTVGAAKTETGTISADVLKVVTGADGGGIVVAVKEDVRERSAPLVDTVVLGNGAITYDPKSNVTPEEQQLLRMLTPGLVNAANLDAGHWSVQTPVGNGTLQTTYLVNGTDNDGRVKLETTADLKATGGFGFSLNAHGNALYNARLLVPVSLSSTSKLREENGAQYKVTDLNVDMSLLSDSFAPKT
ncbi:MAG: hypothetical protein GIW98_06455 [Candidatus Eremiobacteraeota bacterium]|nr:hypothetical protein [Candidatus Eremiobacteraeota bacterium]